MKWQKRRNRAAEFVDPQFAEALLGNGPERSSIDRKVLRKTQQFYRQVQRAANLPKRAHEGLNSLTRSRLQDEMRRLDARELSVRLRLLYLFE